MGDLAHSLGETNKSTGKGERKKKCRQMMKTLGFIKWAFFLEKLVRT